MTTVCRSACADVSVPRLCAGFVTPGSIAAMTLRVDSDRLRADFDALCRDRRHRDGGLERTTFSRGAPRRPRLVPRPGAGRRARAADRRGRQPLGRAPCPRRRLRARSCSARTSTPCRRGGRYDGALGVVCALEVASLREGRGARSAGHARGRRLHRRGGDADRHARQPRARRRAHAARSRGAPRRPRPARRRARADGAHRGGRARPRGAIRASLAGYLELHIEQGPVLERAGVDIGIVTGIIGASLVPGRVRGRGPACGHDADGRPARRGGRRGRVRARREGDRQCATSPARVATVGDIAIEPGSLQRRAGTGTAARSSAARSTARSSMRSSRRSTDRARAEAAALGLEVAVERGSAGRSRCRPTSALRARLRTRPPTRSGSRRCELPSGAGHDAQSLAAVTPSGMVFVPSGRRRQPRPGRADALGGLRQRRERPAQRGGRARPHRARKPGHRLKPAARSPAYGASERGSTSRSSVADPGPRRSSRRPRVGARREPRSGTRPGPGGASSAGELVQAGVVPDTSTRRARARARAIGAARAGRRPTRGRVASSISTSRLAEAGRGRCRASRAPAPPSSRGRARGRTPLSAAQRRIRFAALRPRGASGRSWSASLVVVPARLRVAEQPDASSPAAPPPADERGLARGLRRRARAGEPTPQLRDRRDRVAAVEPVAHEPAADHRPRTADAAPAVDVRGAAVGANPVDVVEDLHHVPRRRRAHVRDRVTRAGGHRRARGRSARADRTGA